VGSSTTLDQKQTLGHANPTPGSDNGLRSLSAGLPIAGPDPQESPASAPRGPEAAGRGAGCATGVPVPVRKARVVAEAEVSKFFTSVSAVQNWLNANSLIDRAVLYTVGRRVQILLRTSRTLAFVARAVCDGGGISIRKGG